MKKGFNKKRRKRSSLKFQLGKEKNRKFDEEKESWDNKVSKLQTDIETLKKSLDTLEKNQMQALSNAQKFKNQTSKESAIKIAATVAQSISEMRAELSTNQEKLAKLMSKKPRL